ncbi:MAG: AbrB/MazE/SpoVT family DNA-binding domain-containing protein [Chloroflexota bacterium]|nr:AbrB/MazE/SpoVT family DNA-binding domain-containing protein [Chloroflexota bacterium]
MNERVSVVTRKGQITIPAEMRKALDLNEGDKVALSLEEGEVRVRGSSGSVVARTAGALRSDAPLLSPEEEREAAERAIAEDVVSRSGV